MLFFWSVNKVYYVEELNMLEYPDSLVRIRDAAKQLFCNVWFVSENSTGLWKMLTN